MTINRNDGPGKTRYLNDIAAIRGNAGVAAVVAQIIALRYSTLPLNWHRQLAGEIQKLEPLRQSPLRQWGCASDFSREYAQHGLNKEITLIHISLCSTPAPFDA
ncbi:TPA: hypothetical protein N3A33_004486 [Salmonella enterica subsp. salamae serovar 28:r:e,n,z15]|nr:hypothetical protein [Salmonella enterica subsp. salamae serovar 28:r:e,n,z15]